MRLPRPSDAVAVTERATTTLAHTTAAAVANVFDEVARGGLADLRPTPARIIDEGPQRTGLRYMPPGGKPLSGTPVLLVPPLASPPTCFDLRRGCSLVAELLARGHPTYLVD